MTPLTASLISFVVGLPSAYAWVVWARAVNRSDAVTAVLSDLVIVAGGLVPTALSISLGDWRILLAGGAANLVGTYIGVRHGRRA